MKKRKSPIPLITGIVILVVAAAAYNLNNSRVANMTPEQQAMEAAQQARQDAQANAPKAAAAAAPSATEVANSVKSAVGAQADGPEGRRPGGSPSSGPTILVPAHQKYKPTPNESATSSQWFSGEHADAKK